MARRKTGIVLLVMLLIYGTGASAQIPERRADSVSIAGSLPVARKAVVLLPASYHETGTRYPVLYLLHGLWGGYEDWLVRSNLIEYTASLPLIVVLPDAADSWYTNSATNPDLRFEDYIAKDVVAFVDENYRTLPFPAARFIAGLSMGGYGAIKLGLLYPGTFSVAGSFSGAFDWIERTETPSINSAFGPAGSPARRDEDVLRIISSAQPAISPYFYLDVGTSDGVLTGNRAVAAALEAGGFAYEYHEVPGDHSWEYWNRRLPFLLSLIQARIADLPPPHPVALPPRFR